MIYQQQIIKIVTFSHYPYIDNNMIENNQKQREAVLMILQDFDINSQSRQFNKALATFLDVEEPKIYQPNIFADKIVQLYDLYNGQYDIYLKQIKFRQLNSDAKDFLWRVFKKYEEKINQKKFMITNQNRLQTPRQHLTQPISTNSNQNMNMSMANLMMEVPNFQTVQQVQIFQRKMFQVFRNFLPQVLSSIPMPMNSQSQLYRNHFQQFNLGGTGGITGMANMTGMAGMNSMSNLQGMGGMAGIGGIPNMGGMAGIGGIPNMGGMQNMASQGMPNNNISSMTSLGGFPNKQQCYDTPTFGNRYFYESSKPASFSQNEQQNQKMPINDFRSQPIQMAGMSSFNYCGDRFNQELRNPRISQMIPHTRMGSTIDQFQRRQIKSKFIQYDQRYDSSYHNLHTNEQANDKKVPKMAERDRQSYSKQPSSSQPRKQHKKHEQKTQKQKVQISQAKSKVWKLNCTCGKQGVACFYCGCLQIDPQNEVDQILLLEKVNSENNKIAFTISKKILQKVFKNSDRLDIELRCIRMDKQLINQINWPEKYCLKIDDQIVQSYLQPSQTTFQKRKDKSIVLGKLYGIQKLKQEKISICMEAKFSQQQQKSRINQYAYGIFVIIKNSYQKMYEKITNKLIQQNISEFVSKKSEDPRQKIDDIIVQTHQSSIGKLIKNPVRGKHCSHAQCFDLETFLSFLAISPVREWKCPICGKDVKQMVIDKQQKTILTDIAKMIKIPDEIIFFKDGSHNIRYKQEEREEAKNSNSQENRNQSSEEGQN